MHIGNWKMRVDIIRFDIQFFQCFHVASICCMTSTKMSPGLEPASRGGEHILPRHKFGEPHRGRLK